MATKIASKLEPAVTKTVLLGLTTGVASNLASLGVDKLLSDDGAGNGKINNKIQELNQAIYILSQEINKLNTNQKKQFDMIASNQSGQSGNFLGTLLASISIPFGFKSFRC